jgi:hypothetical protein
MAQHYLNQDELAQIPYTSVNQSKNNRSLKAPNIQIQT